MPDPSRPVEDAAAAGILQEDHRRGDRARLPELARELDVRMRARAVAGWVGEAQNGLDLLRFKRWRLAGHLGYDSWLGYAQRVLDYGRTMAKVLCNVAEACEELPQLRKAWLAGEIRWRKARWVAQAATLETEAEWLERAKVLPEWKLQALATGKLPKQRVAFELTPNLKARLDAHLRAQRLRSQTTDSGEALVELLDGATSFGEAPRLSSPVQIVIHLCGECGRATQEGKAGSLPVGPAQLAAARCRAKIVDVRGGPARVTSDIPDKTRRHVLARDKGRCQVPGCTNDLVDIHHLDGRAGGHDHRRMLLLCDAHHRKFHLGALLIEGEPGTFRFFNVEGREIVVGPDRRPLLLEPKSPEEVAEEVLLALQILEITHAHALRLIERAFHDDPRRPWLAEDLFKVAIHLWRDGGEATEPCRVVAEVTDVTPPAEVTDVTPPAAVTDVTETTPATLPRGPALVGPEATVDREVVVSRVLKGLRVLELPARRASAMVKHVLAERPVDYPWSDGELLGAVLRAS